MTKKKTKKQVQVELNKKKLLEALEKSLGVKTTACKSVGIGRTTLHRYIEEDKEFAKAVDEIQNVALDFAESQLHKQIQEGVPASTIFYLKTKGKKRGYGDRLAVDHGIDKMPEGTSFGVTIHRRKEE